MRTTSNFLRVSWISKNSFRNSNRFSYNRIKSNKKHCCAFLQISAISKKFNCFCWNTTKSCSLSRIFSWSIDLTLLHGHLFGSSGISLLTPNFIFSLHKRRYSSNYTIVWGKIRNTLCKKKKINFKPNNYSSMMCAFSSSFRCLNNVFSYTKTSVNMKDKI